MGPTTLIVSESDDPHVRIVTEQLAARNGEYDFLKVDELGTFPGSWEISTTETPSNETWVNPDVGTVWYRRRTAVPRFMLPAEESLKQQETEGVLRSIYQGYDHCRWINPLSAIEASRGKIAQLQNAARIGMTVPDSILTFRLDDLQDFFHKHAGDIVVKPVQAQVVETETANCVLGTRRIKESELVNSLAVAPCFAQRNLEIDFEVRVIVFGERYFAFRMKRKGEADDIKQLPLDAIEHEVFELDKTVARQLQQLVKHYSLLFAAVDLVANKQGELTFLEINPNGQWLWLQYMTGFDLVNPFIDLLLE